ncbi:MAG: hypothetical protein LBS00_12280, partial [Synergistaceae bacterium]|nr:hypothetical protein [Synergistaceae bacterium]
MSGYVDNAVSAIAEKWRDHKEVSTLARQMEILGKNMAHLRDGKDAEARKKARIVWQKASTHYWDLLWAIVEAKIDAGPPCELEFDDAERLLIDFGHLSSGYTTPNPAFEEHLGDSTAVDMYQYDRLTDYIRESYALIFGKPYHGPSGGVTMEEKLRRFENELKTAKIRRKVAINTLVSKIDVIEKKELEDTLKNLDEGLTDAIATDMRTKRVREADNAARAVIKEHCKQYETAERTFWYLMENIEKKISKVDAPKAEEIPAAAPHAASPPRANAAFDPFIEIEDDYIEMAKNIKPAPEPDEAAPEYRPDSVELPDEPESEATVETMREEPVAEQESPDQSLKIVQNVLSLHDRTKFLAGLIVHVTNETERWKTKVEMANKKFKGQGVPALKLELREGINHKKEFMTLAARTARVDTSPLCQNKNKPISMSRAGEVMMDLTPLDPD